MPMRKILLTLIVAVLLTPAAALAQPAVLLVRHAERADDGMAAGPGADPNLSPTGRARAKTLAAMLKDARITEIYVTEFKRTRQTAEPLAKLLGLTPTVIAASDTPSLMARLKAAPGNVLVIGHTNSVPAVIKSLGVAEPITIAETEYDNLFVVGRGATPSLVRLRYRR
jgi:phosphohistidine phosphatase SixA